MRSMQEIMQSRQEEGMQINKAGTIEKICTKVAMNKAKTQERKVARNQARKLSSKVRNKQAMK